MSSQNLILLQPFDDGKCGLFGGTDGKLIAIVETQESAERLLIAWNSHDDLVEACRALMRLHYDEGMPSAEGLETVCMAEETIKKATIQP